MAADTDDNKIYGREVIARQMELRNKKAWKSFVDGGWTKVLPDKAGTYPTATREGYRGPDRTLAVKPKTEDQIIDCSNMTSREGTEWKGWWWTEPFPSLPLAPNWEEDDGTR